ncbi:dethiobiotin synthase [Sphingobacterium detergens]|uniref:ATP-dependent dethiobiotin synthetase BioD n=1 Tax=Sphingobacterium detergens TaxID=1145106 RepID=A0A420ADV7_SPHD1|nr:dethiobiotin synthase [Sphingobacterium detergens]RKE42631.1 dethiobiotin synthase [Sphingobacterium detergens]
MKNNIYFVSGIDTGIGKSYATGLIAKQWNAEGLRTITQKLVQTGNTTISEDIILHRQLMGIAFTEDDQEKITMPEIFSYPASPHLAAQIDKREIDFEKIKQATAQLSQRYDAVLVEGAGGLMVPLIEDYLIIDYIKEMGYPLLFVTSGKLGSINHTLLSLEAIATRGINLHTVIYNTFPVLEDSTISTETQRYLRNYIQKHFPETKFITL